MSERASKELIKAQLAIIRSKLIRILNSVNEVENYLDPTDDMPNLNYMTNEIQLLQMNTRAIDREIRILKLK